jgi:hypothetical protein
MILRYVDNSLTNVIASNKLLRDTLLKFCSYCFVLILIAEKVSKHFNVMKKEMTGPQLTLNITMIFPVSLVFCFVISSKVTED